MHFNNFICAVLLSGASAALLSSEPDVKGDLECIPVAVDVCSGEGCVHCPPPGALGEKLECIPVDVCTGEGCVHCPPPAEEVGKRAVEEDGLVTRCIPICIKGNCNHCPRDESQKRSVKENFVVKESTLAPRCIPICIKGRCNHCPPEEAEKRDVNEDRVKPCPLFCIGHDCVQCPPGTMQKRGL